MASPNEWIDLGEWALSSKPEQDPLTRSEDNLFGTVSSRQVHSAILAARRCARLRLLQTELPHPLLSFELCYHWL